jgi:hypothetical protein
MSTSNFTNSGAHLTWLYIYNLISEKQRSTDIVIGIDIATFKQLGGGPAIINATHRQTCTCVIVIRKHVPGICSALVLVSL